MLCQQGKRDLNTWRDAKRKCLRFWIAAHWEYHFWHTEIITSFMLPCFFPAPSWHGSINIIGVANRKRKGHGQCPWTRDNEGPLSGATVGGSKVVVSCWRVERKIKALEGQGITAIAIYWRWGLFSLEREDRHVLNKLSCLGNDTVLDRSFSSLFNLQRDCEKTQSIRTNLNHLFDHLANCKHCLWENNLSSE